MASTMSRKTIIAKKEGANALLSRLPRPVKASLFFLFPLLFWVGVFAALSALVGSSFLLPSPIEILSRLLTLMGTATFWQSTLFSLLRVTSGLLFGVLIGLLLSLLAFLIPLLARLIFPLLTVMKSTPVASVIILLWVFTGSESLPIFIAALLVLPVVAEAVYTGLTEADPALLEMLRLFDVSKKKEFLYYRLPAALPYFMTALSTSVGFAWKAGISAEILAYTENSIGREIYLSKVYLETPDLFAWTLLVIILSLIIELIVKKTFRIGRKQA